jgi:cytochrome oxidase Cu insertion factor (SCO1/SenC/PrrC family)
VTTPADPARTGTRRQAWILVALFFVPLIAAFVLYYGMDGWRPAGSTAKGDLIHPPRPLPQNAVLTSPPTSPMTSAPVAKGAALDAKILHGKWTLVYVGGGECDARCREALTLMRQTRLALNDDASRVQRLFLAMQPCCDQAYLDAEHAGLTVASADDAAGQAVLAVFPRYGDKPVEQAGRIYIIDPLGNLMMSYSPQAEHKDLLEDLKKLLKLSHIG